MPDNPAARWLEAAEKRYLADLTVPEVTRALRALSSCYVERRGKLARGEALATNGKRAAFALFYAPLHFLTVREIAAAVATIVGSGGTVVDLGCGTGAAGAAWALATGARVEAFDVNAWAVEEAAWTYRTMGIRATVHRVPIERVKWPSTPATIVAAFVINELPADTRAALLPRLLTARQRVLIVEPIARGVVPWWPEWQSAFEANGGRADEWRFAVELPELVTRFDRAAGLDHRELTARTLMAGF